MALARTWYQTVLSLPLFFLGSSVLGHQPQLLWGNSKFSTTARDTQQISLEWGYTVRLTIPKWPDLRLVKHSQFIQSFTVRHFGKTTPSSRSVEATKKLSRMRLLMLWERWQRWDGRTAWSIARIWLSLRSLAWPPRHHPGSPGMCRVYL